MLFVANCDIHRLLNQANNRRSIERRSLFGQ